MGASAAARLDRPLTALGVDHDIEVYPEQARGSETIKSRAAMTAWLVILNKVSGTRYHEPSALDARRHIAAFFHQI